MRRLRVPQPLLRSLAAVSLAAALGAATGARAEMLQISSDGQCHAYDTVTRQMQVSPGECQGEAATPVKNVKDLKALLREKTAATDFEVVDGSYIGLVETVAAAHESARLQAYALASGRYAIVSEIDMTVSVQINAPGWRKHAAPDNRWNFKNSLLSFSFRNQPVVFFTTALDEATVAEGSNFAQRASIARVQKYLATYLETGVLPDEDGVSVKINHGAVWPQIEQVADRLQLRERIERSLARLALQLPGVENPGLDARDSELVQVLQAENARLTAEVSSLTERLGSAESYNRALIEKLERTSAEAEQLREALEVERTRTAECEHLAAKQAATIAELEARNQELEARYAELDKTLEQERWHYETKLAELEQKNLELEKANAEKTVMILELEKQREAIIAKYEAELMIDAQRIAELQEALERLEIEREVLKVELDGSRRDNERLNQELEAERMKLEEIIAKYKVMLEEDAKRIAELDDKVQQLEIERALLKKELEVADEDIARLEREREEVRQERDKLAVRIAELEKEVTAYKQELAAVKEILGVTTEERDQAIVEREIFAAKLEDADKSLAALREQFAALQDRSDRYVSQVADLLGVSCDLRLEDKEQREREEQSYIEDLEREELENHQVYERAALDEPETTHEEGGATEEIQAQLDQLVQAEDPSTTLYSDELQPETHENWLENLGTCDAATLAPLTLEAMREKINQIFGLRAELAQSLEKVSGLQTEIDDLRGDIFEARQEAPSHVIDAVFDAAREKRLIAAKYTEGGNLDLVTNAVTESIASARAALTCGHFAQIPQEAESVARLEEVLDRVDTLVLEARKVTSEGVCDVAASKPIGEAVRALEFVNEVIGATEATPLEYVYQVCGGLHGETGCRCYWSKCETCGGADWVPSSNCPAGTKTYYW